MSLISESPSQLGDEEETGDLATPVLVNKKTNPVSMDNQDTIVSKIIKTEDDSIPLLKHYRSEVELNLKSGKSGKMTKNSMSSFLSAVASAMQVYKRYPSKDDYISVARSVIDKYSFMSSPVGTPYVSLCYLSA